MSEWIEWVGGECPVEGGVMLNAVCGNGRVWDNVPAHTLDWKGDCDKYSVRRYCIANEPDEPEWGPQTIEQLVAEYRAKLATYERAQEELTSHRCGVEAALSRLEAAGDELGLVV